MQLSVSPTFLETWNFPDPANAPFVCFILLLSPVLFREEEKKHAGIKNALERLPESGDGGE